MFRLVTKPSSSPSYHGVGPLVDPFRLSHPEVSSVVSPGSFSLLVCNCLLSSVFCYEAFCFHVVPSFICSPVFCSKLGLYLIPLRTLYLFSNLFKCIPLFFVVYLISAAAAAAIFLALIDQFSLLYNKAGRASKYNFILVFFQVLCGLNIF